MEIVCFMVSVCSDVHQRETRLIWLASRIPPTTTTRMPLRSSFRTGDAPTGALREAFLAGQGPYYDRVSIQRSGIRGKKLPPELKKSLDKSATPQ